MKLFLIAFAFLSLSINSFAQSTKKVKHKISNSEYETYTVLKSDKSIKHGEYALFVNDRKTESGFYDKNVKQGLWTTYYRDKTISSQGNFENNLKEGSWVYNSNYSEKPLSKGSYSKGLKTGKWTYYGYKELISADGSFLNDKRIGIWNFYTKGDLYQTYNFETKSLQYAGPAGADTLTGNLSDPYKGLIFADSIAVFKSGESAMYSFLGRTMRYPPVARDSNIQGRVYVSFIIDNKGKTQDIKILRGIGGGCDEEAIRVVKLMQGKWNPATFEGENVSMRYNLPLVFRLQ